jgi:hypothetical protein
MKTRSQTLKEEQIQKKNSLTPLYEVNIDFDEASEAWRANKKCLKNGMYAYICGKIMLNGNSCSRNRATGGDYCKMHNKSS